MKCLTFMLMFVFSATAGLKIGTFNIRNFDKPGSPTDKKLLKETILKNNPDLLGVQEIYDKTSFTRFVKKELKGYSVALSSCGGGGAQKLGFIYKEEKMLLTKSFEDRRLSNAFNSSCGSLRPAFIGIFQMKNSNEQFVAISVHLKAGSGNRNFQRRAKQYNDIEDIFNEFRQAGFKNIVAVGDFNTTGYNQRNQDYMNFSRLLTAARATTSAEKISCTSYWSGRDYQDGIEEASTLDHIVSTENFLGHSEPRIAVGSHCAVAQCENVYEDVLGRTYEAVSDHCPVTAHFE